MRSMLRLSVMLWLLCGSAAAGPVHTQVPFREPPKYEIPPEQQLQMCCNCCPYDKYGQAEKLCMPIPGPKCNSMGWGCFGTVFCPK
jgi:hypothetical protein